VSIAAMIDGELVAGAILNAATGELFTATAGGVRGGPVNRLRSRRSPIPRGLSSEPASRSSRNPHTPRYLEMLRVSSRARRAFVAPAPPHSTLADVACGRFDAFWELTLAPWDIAAESS
jgi:myo-inositol-1(or 4)-monophosphatase